MRFYFHLWMPDKLSHDPHGTDLASPEEAREAARASIQVLEIGLRDAGQDPRQCVLLIYDESGAFIDRMPLGDAEFH